MEQQLIGELTPAQKVIVRELCYKQLSSLRRIYTDDHLSGEDITMELIKHEVSKEEFNGQLLINMERMKELANDPDKLHGMTDKELSMLRHILTNIEDQYNEKYPNAVSNLWQRFFFIEKYKDINLN